MTSELRVAVRSLAKSPRFSLAVVLTMSLGLGATVAVFSIASALLLQPLPFPRSEGLVHVGEINPARDDLGSSVSPADYEVLRNRKDLFDGLAVSEAGFFTDNLVLPGLAEEISAGTMSFDFFRVTGSRPILGRAFSPADSSPNAPKVLMISYELWTRVFGRAGTVLGRVVRFGNQAAQIVGVMPADFVRYDRSELWVPLELTGPTNRVRYLDVIARLRAGISRAQVVERLDALAKSLALAHPDTNAGYSFQVLPLRRRLVGDFERPLTILLLSVGGLLLIACVNVSNLMLARGAYRRKETALRVALGASNGRIARMLLAEAFVLATISIALATPMAWGAIRLIRSLAPPDVWQLDRVSLDGRTLLFGAVVTAMAATAFTLVPAWWVRRVSPAESLSAVPAPGSLAGFRGIGGALVILEIALAFPLLVGASLMFESLVRLNSADLGIHHDQLVTSEIRLPRYRYRSPAAQRDFFRRLLDDLRASPETASAGAVLFDPISAFPGGRREFQLEGQPLPRPGEQTEAAFKTIDPGYLSVARIPVIAGRGFADSDDDRSAAVALVSRSFARRYLASGPLLGRHLAIRFPSRIEHASIVGVVGDVASWPDVRVQPTILMSYLQDPVPLMTLVVQSSLPPSTIGAAIRRTVARIDPEQPVRPTRSVNDFLRTGLAPRRFLALLLEGFGLLGLALAAAGSYSVISYLMERRRREIGIRTALGAQTGDILALFVGRALGWAVVGTILGAAAALGLAHLLASQVYGVAPTEPRILAAVAALLILESAFAAWVPARRSARSDPLLALRSE